MAVKDLSIFRSIAKTSDHTCAAGTWFSGGPIHLWSGRICWRWGGPPIPPGCHETAFTLRFRGISLPQDATILAAHAHLQSSQFIQRDNCNVSWHAERHPSPFPPYNAADFWSRNLTLIAGIDTIIPHLPIAADYVSPDLSGPIMELLTLFPLQDAAIQFFCVNHISDESVYRSFGGRLHSATSNPYLVIKFRVPFMPESDKFLVVAEEDAYVGECKIITETTDQPAHLRLCRRRAPPKRHDRLRMRRGVEDWQDPHWGFDEVECFEQQEEGDTLIHTFEVCPWLEGDEWYYRFEGSVSGGDSPSVSPFFHQTRPIPPPPPPIPPGSEGPCEDWFRTMDIAYLVGSRFIAPSTRLLYGIDAYTNFQYSDGPHYPITVQYAIYDCAPMLGGPLNLIATTEAVNFVESQPTGWIYLPFPEPVPVAEGSCYHLIARFDTHDTGYHVYTTRFYRPVPEDRWLHKRVTTTPFPFPDPLEAYETQPREMCILGDHHHEH